MDKLEAERQLRTDLNQPGSYREPESANLWLRDGVAVTATDAKKRGSPQYSKSARERCPKFETAMEQVLWHQLQTANEQIAFLQEKLGNVLDHQSSIRS